MNNAFLGQCPECCEAPYVTALGDAATEPGVIESLSVKLVWGKYLDTQMKTFLKGK